MANKFIQSVSDAGSGQVTVFCASHGIPEGQKIVMYGTAGYDGFFVATNVTSDTFRIVATWSATSTGWVATNIQVNPELDTVGIMRQKLNQLAVLHGNNAELNTTDKSSLVAAVNELLQDAGLSERANKVLALALS